MAWAEWIRATRWTYWARVDFREEDFWWPEAKARRAVERWITVSSRRSRRVVYGVAGFERGPLRNVLHANCLIGGLHRHPSPLIQLRWEHGEAWAEPYRPRDDPPGQRRGASYYLSKLGTDHVEWYGPLPPYRPRHRGGRDR